MGRCTSILLYVLPVCWCTHVPLPRDGSVFVYQCTSVPGHYCRRRFGVPVNPCPGESVSYYTDIPTYCYTCVPKHRCTHVHDEAMCPCTSLPVYRCAVVPA